MITRNSSISHNDYYVHMRRWWAATYLLLLPKLFRLPLTMALSVPGVQPTYV